MKHFVSVLGIALMALTSARGETELKGSPTELSSYLATVPKLVTVRGEAEVKVPSDQVSVLVSAVCAVATGLNQAISSPRIVPVADANLSVSNAMRCSMETNRLGSG